MTAPTIPPPPPPPPPGPPPAPPASARVRPPLRQRAGVALTLLASGTQVLAAFHHWHPEGDAVALDLALAGPPLATVGVLLLVLAALPALAALGTPAGWPRVVSAFGTAVVVLAWVALGPVGLPATGVWLAAGAVCGHLVAAALAP